MPSNVTIMPADLARNLGEIFDSILSMSNHISSVSKSCFSSVHDLRKIRNTPDFTTAHTILLHLSFTKTWLLQLSPFFNLPQSQLSCLQLILNSTAWVVSKTPKSSHIIPVLKSLNSLKIEQSIQYNVISLTYKTLQSNKPTHLSDLLHIQRNRNTRSFDIVTVQRPYVCSSLKLTDRSFTHHARVLWNSLPKQLRQPTPHQPSINQTCSTLSLSYLSFMRNSKRSSSTDHSLLSLYTLPLMLVLWFFDPTMFFISYLFSVLSFTVISFIAIVSENKSPSVIAVLVGFSGHSQSPIHSHSSFILYGVIIIIKINK